MKHFVIGSDDLDLLIDIFDLEYCDTLEGSLLDNYILCGDNITLAVFEKYLNCWSSCYDLFVARTQEENETLWNKWDKLKEVIKND